MKKLYKALFTAKTMLLVALWLFISAFVSSSHTGIKRYAFFFDTTLCGSSVTLNATTGLTNYKWSTGATTQSINVTASGNYWWETIDYTNNKVVNGTFTSGNTGFTSSYVVPPGAQNNSLLYPEGTYAITKDPNNVHSGFSSFYDHTTSNNSGKMMVINGASVANVTVWSENITVAPNTNYLFSVWFASAHPASPGQLNFSINGSPLGTTIQLSTTTGVWQNFTTTWNSGSSTTATIGLINQNTAASGNDFAMDDVVFAPIYHHDIAVTLNPNPVLTVTAAPSSCAVYNLTNAISGYDAATYTYVFKDASNNVVSTTNAQAITVSGTYTVTAQNKVTGCISAAKSITVTINPVPSKPNVTSP
ncbi:hypothetical protein KXQ82_18380 [Mucilaginibacter sp. HMF5004]|uniref:hypothetical protein n=1 Tax=Mucilaginibacter rivuli TaxID=2857527 RepID=UPI001C5E937D|nr:hypothetical protein [Mucilaginibacter rivuli]MBW4891698.1 hypothetical protein [Mucilaginibacter rivuli]